MILTQSGAACSTIIVGNQATWLDMHTASELQSYIQKISGATLLIVKEQDAHVMSGGRILIGRPSTCRMIRDFAMQESVLPEQSDTDNDCIAIVVRGSTMVLSGSNDRSVHYSACHLLQTVFSVGFYSDGDSWAHNPDMAVEDRTFVERSPFRFRHTVGQWVYNFGAFLNGDERKRELDMYARNKINSYRFYTWNTYVRKRTFQKMGVKTEPITREDLVRMEAVRETAAYARSLGIDTMVQMMIQETSLEFRKAYPDARYFGCEWVKDDENEPDTVPFLYPDDPLYKTLVKTFVQTWIETYGPCRHFTACPPSEHHISTDIEDFIQINLDFARYTYEAIREVVPDGRLFFDGWGVRANTPPSIWTMPGVMQRFVDALPEEVYFLDLWPNRKETDSTFREPMFRDETYGPLHRARYILEPLNEFGGDDHLHGEFERHIQAARQMLDPTVVEHGEGFGNCTELCGTSVHFFDLIFRLAWDPARVTTADFLEDTAKRRYGLADQTIAVKALEALQQAVYSERDSSHARYQKRCYLSRPQRRLVPIAESMEVAELLDRYMELMSSLPEAQKTVFVGRDMFDVMRQYITEYFNMHLRSLFEGFLSRGAQQEPEKMFRSHAVLLEQLLDLLEQMLREDPESYVETMVRRYQGRPGDPDVSGTDCNPQDFRRWMRDMGTTFAETIPNLIDYPSRDYYELVRDYYHPRIRSCILQLQELLNDGGAASAPEVDRMLEQHYQTVEQHWIREGYAVTDECEYAHLPLWRAAERAWRTLRLLPLKSGLDSTEKQGSASGMIDVFASFSENKQEPGRRGWVSENPFAKKDG